MKTNVAVKKEVRTHEGAVASVINPEQALRRSIMTCMLWEDTHYENGEDVADRIASLIPHVKPLKVSDMAVAARNKMKLRHAPLFIVREMARSKTHRNMVAITLANVIQRADELSEFVSIYWKKGKEPLSAQAKKGLAKAFQKFSAYDLAKYNQDGAVKLRDVLFLCHAKPKDDEQAVVWKKLVEGKLESPDTWEVELSASKDKKASWERLLSENKLGGLALLRNLRNMSEAQVERPLVKKALDAMRVDRVLPFRFITAARIMPQWEDMLETPMLKCLEEQARLPGHTALLLDVSGSMAATISQHSEVTRMDAGFGLGVLLREICEEVSIFTFSESLTQVALRRGFALRDAMKNSQPHSGTYLAGALAALHSRFKYDRIIVITDEQSHDGIESPRGKGYVINVAPYQNGVGYGPWTHIDGWSEAVLDFIRLSEHEEQVPA